MRVYWTVNPDDAWKPLVYTDGGYGEDDAVIINLNDPDLAREVRAMTVEQRLQVERLLVQCAPAMPRGDELAICASCSTPFTPSRKPNPNRSSYCPSCGLRAANRDAARRYRAKKKEAA